MSTASLIRPAPHVITDEQEYRILLAATFPVFLAAVAVRRLGRLLGGLQPAGKSLFAEARDAGHATLLFAFMG